jgi:hypothetical protein
MAKIQIEDLLKIKTAEAPPAEFWDRFEVELKKKQLKAFVSSGETLPNVPTRNWVRSLVALSASLALPFAFGAVALVLWQGANSGTLSDLPTGEIATELNLRPIETLAAVSSPLTTAQETDRRSANFTFPATASANFVVDALSASGTLSSQGSFSRDLSNRVYTSNFNSGEVVADMVTLRLDSRTTPAGRSQFSY